MQIAPSTIRTRLAAPILVSFLGLLTNAAVAATAPRVYPCLPAPASSDYRGWITTSVGPPNRRDGGTEQTLTVAVPVPKSRPHKEYRLEDSSSVTDFSAEDADLMLWDSGGDDIVSFGPGMDVIHDDSGDDTYVVAARGAIDSIYDAGGSDTLVLTTEPGAELRIERSGIKLYIGGALLPRDVNRPAGGLPHRVEIDIEKGRPDVERYIINGVRFSLDEILALANSPPWVRGRHYDVRRRFAGGVVAALQVHDRDPVELTILSVCGHGAASRWWIESERVHSDAGWDGTTAAETRLTLRASDGEYLTDDLIFVRWRPVAGE